MDGPQNLWSEPRAPRRWSIRPAETRAPFGTYREAICWAFMPLRPEIAQAERPDFWADVTSCPVGESALNLVRARCHQVVRSRREIAASPEGCFYINLQYRADSEISQRGTSACLKPGDVGFFDGGERFEIDHGGSAAQSVASLMIPKRQLAKAGYSLPEGGVLKLSAEPRYGALLRDAFDMLAARAQRGGRNELARLQHVVLELAMLAAEGGAARAGKARGAAAAHPA